MTLVKDVSIVYICYPTTTGDINENVVTILHLCRDIQFNCPNTIPFTPYLNYFRYLDISDHRQMNMVIENTRTFFERRVMDQMWVAGMDITEEMSLQIEWAVDYDIPTLAYSAIIAKDLECYINEYENKKTVLH